jgi:photosystem II stability/assembly factor-like uncharacterized protein
MAEPIHLYAGTQNGVKVWQSNNGNWEEVSHGLPDDFIEDLAGCNKRPERVFAAIARNGLYRTEDGGKHWVKVLVGDVKSVAIDPTSDDVIYVGTEPPRLYRSEDGGDCWEELTSLTAYALAQGIRIYQTFIVKRDKHPEDVRENWWHPVPPHLAHSENIFVHAEDPRTIFLSIEHGGVLRSHDRGNSWQNVSAGIDYRDIHVVRSLPHRLDRYYVSSAQGFFTSDDPAQGWVRAERGFTRDYYHDFIFLPPSREGSDPIMLVATADKSPGAWNQRRSARSALFRSSDCAQSWQRVVRGIPEELAPMIWSLANHPYDSNSAFAGLGQVRRSSTLAGTGSAGNGTIMMTRDRGESWEKLPVDLAAARSVWAAGS